MSIQIAVAGKGGTGKTTFTALLIRHLTKSGKKSVLAVDADANANLNEALGLKLPLTISELIASTKDPKAIPTGMTQEAYIEYKLQASLVESDHVDMLVMGGPDGPGCYCFPNNLLRGYMEKLGKNYDYVVMDNEAGLEHISRRVTQAIDYMFIISDASARSIRSAGRVRQLIDGMKSDIKNISLIVTKTQALEDIDALKDEIEKTGLNLIGVIPYDPLVAKYDLSGQALFELPQDAKAIEAVDAILKKAQI